MQTVRIFNTYGPPMRVDDGWSIPNFVSQALRGEELTVYDTGEQPRSFCHVTDLVDGICCIAEAPARRAAGEVFDPGHTSEITILTLAELIRDLVDTESDIA